MVRVIQFSPGKGYEVALSAVIFVSKFEKFLVLEDQ